MSAVKTETASGSDLHSLLERMPSKECHCHRCGARIAEGDARCAACGKKQQVKNTNLLDFLIAHTKDEITGKITDSIYEAVKNFLLSHLFGVVVSLSLVAAVGVTVYASEPYIDRVSGAQRPTLSAEQEMLLYELNIVAQELGYADAEEMLREQGDWETYEELFGSAEQPQPSPEQNAQHQEVIDLLQRYIFHTMQDPSTEMEYGGTFVSAGDIAASLRLEQAEDYGLTCAFSAAEVPDGHHYISYEPTNFDTSSFSGRGTRALQEDGYTVGETMVSIQHHDLDTDRLLYKEVYLFVTVRTDDGRLYVAGSELLFRQGSYGHLQDDPELIKELAGTYVQLLLDGSTDAMPQYWPPQALPMDTVHELPALNTDAVIAGTAYPAVGYAVGDITLGDRSYSSVTQSLLDAGYEAADCVVDMLYEIPVDAAAQDKPAEMGLLLSMVKLDGTWYIAEDILLFVSP